MHIKMSRGAWKGVQPYSDGHTPEKEEETVLTQPAMSSRARIRRFKTASGKSRAGADWEGPKVESLSR